MILGFLAVEGEGQISARCAKAIARSRHQRNALVGRPEQYMSISSSLAKNRLGVELRQIDPAPRRH
jgi:hypothetical protein